LFVHLFIVAMVTQLLYRLEIFGKSMCVELIRNILTICLLCKAFFHKKIYQSGQESSGSTNESRQVIMNGT
jgi:hypothetical protein